MFRTYSIDKLNTHIIKYKIMGGIQNVTKKDEPQDNYSKRNNILRINPNNIAINEDKNKQRIEERKRREERIRKRNKEIDKKSKQIEKKNSKKFIRRRQNINNYNQTNYSNKSMQSENIIKQAYDFCDNNDIQNDNYYDYNYNIEFNKNLDNNNNSYSKPIQHIEPTNNHIEYYNHNNDINYIQIEKQNEELKKLKEKEDLKIKIIQEAIEQTKLCKYKCAIRKRKK